MVEERLATKRDLRDLRDLKEFEERITARMQTLEERLSSRMQELVETPQAGSWADWDVILSPQAVS